MVRRAARLLSTVPALALLLGAAVPASARPRVDGRVALVAGGRAPARLLGPLATAAGVVRLAVEAPDCAVRLARAGFVATAATARQCYATVAVGELARLVALDGIVAVERERRLHPSLDASTAAIGAPEARARFSVDGSGALVGVVDSGIDFRHDDVRRADGTTRIAALLDLASPADTLHASLGDYGGAVRLADDIDRQLASERGRLGRTGGDRAPLRLVVERDTFGHGTHVAGIAAGNGRATGNGLPAGRYVGVAPGAGLVIAQATRDGASFGEADVLSSVRFLVDRARDLGRPIAINVSLNGEGGPHDGTTSLERALATLVPDDAPGRALVVSAGNDGAHDHHAGGWSLDGSLTVSIDVPHGAGLALDLWTEAGPTPPALTLIAPDGRSFAFAAGATLDAEGLPEGRVVVGNAGLAEANGRREATVDVFGASPGDVAQQGTWRLVLDGKVARWDLWLTGAETGGARLADHLDATTSVDLPAFAASAIAVGSFVTKARWTTALGNPVARMIAVGDTSRFSAAGPSADGRFVPDVLAPGEFIAAALSSDATPDSPASLFAVPDQPDYLWADDGHHALMHGTSQAAPHVTGACALLLALDPSLTPARLREILRASARVVDGVSGFSAREGFGRLDVARAIALVRHAPVGPVDAQRSTVGTSRDAIPPGQATRISVVPRDAEGAPLGPGHAVTIATDAGRLDGAPIDAGAGRWEQTLTATADAPAATLSVTVDGVLLAAHPRVLFASSADLAGGGCSVARPSRFPSPPLLLLLAALPCLALRRRRAPSSNAATRARVQ